MCQILRKNPSAEAQFARKAEAQGCLRLTRIHRQLHSGYVTKKRTLDHAGWCCFGFMRKPSVLVVFLTVFIDLIGFGIVLPLLPIYTRNFGAKGWMIGAIMGSYSLMQFLF